ncbi:MAG: hypothetical protein AB1679_12190 [Actinomycetota bacterium]
MPDYLIVALLELRVAVLEHELQLSQEGTTLPTILREALARVRDAETAWHLERAL